MVSQWECPFERIREYPDCFQDCPDIEQCKEKDVWKQVRPLPTVIKMAGTELITKERQRQIKKEGYSAEHDDDRYHSHGELAMYACCLATPDLIYIEKRRQGSVWFADPYPEFWDEKFDRRAKDGAGIIPNSDLDLPERIRNLVKAGALIAAEIDRLQRLNK